MKGTIIIVLLTFVSFFRADSVEFLAQLELDQDHPLSSGEIFKIKIDQTGVYEIKAAWLGDKIGADHELLPSKSIQIFGIPGGPVPHDQEYEMTTRLIPLPMYIEDGNDGVIDNQDVIRFYAEGTDQISFDEDSETYSLKKNPFSESAFVFLKVESGITQCLIQQDSQLRPPSIPSSVYRYLDFYHEDKVNLLDNFISTQGSGQRWYGNELTNVGSTDLHKLLKIPQGGIQDAKLNIKLAGRSRTGGEITVTIEGDSNSQQFIGVNTSDIEALYARNFEIDVQHEFLGKEDQFLLSFKKQEDNARLWLDNASIDGITPAIYDQHQLFLYDPPQNGVIPSDGIRISTTKKIIVWDISNQFEIVQKNIHVIQGKSEILRDPSSANRFICFDAQNVLTPQGLNKIPAQKLLDNSDVDLIIVTPHLLKDAALKLANHRLEHDQLKSFIVTPEDIYNEYSGGRMDPTSIRNYIREVYRTKSRFKYLLLLGDASFDYRHINKNHTEDNLVPTYETVNSLDPLLAFPSDDYYALLDNDENGNLTGDLDIAVGRITVSTPKEANNVINKIIRYDRTSSQIDSWKTNIAFLADDEDNNLHINDADVIANEVTRNFPLANQEKIYFDAFRQESTPGGNRYPSATNRLNSIVHRGALVVNYLGHGGPNGWAQERVLKIDDINNWTNLEKLPLIITATCSFTGFDDPSTLTAGEAALLHPNGGALALFTTVRSVFASKNFQLTRSVFRELFVKENGGYLTIGEIMRRSKNENPSDNTNARKFFLIGDPTIKLSLPGLEIKTEKINGVNLDSIETEIQVSALDRVNIKASVRHPDGSDASTFNGTVEIVVYDKASDIQTFANDNRSFKKTFKSQKNIIYQGRSTVSNGNISTSFTVPVDIDYVPGNAKISYYALSDNLTEAAGYIERLIVGGNSVDPVFDDAPPTIRAYLNDRSFNNGEIVPPSNLVIIDLEDDYGINVSSAAIGHEITAVLDESAQNTFFLNELLIGASDNPRAGSITFALEELAPGSHSLRIKAFDVANNPAEYILTFEVSTDIERHISNIENDPNPFSNSTIFKIYHDFLDGEISVNMRVFDMAGRLVERVSKNVISKSGILEIEWIPKIEGSGHFVCHFTIKSRSSKDSAVTSAKKVILLK